MVAPVQSAPAPKAAANTYTSNTSNNANHHYNRVNKAPTLPYETRVDVSDSALWPQAHLLLTHFPGTITQIRDIA